MGRASRPKPERLAEKLRQIRESLGLTQDEMLRKLGIKDESGIERSSISAYELGKREPPLQVLLVYARVANVWMDVLVDDDLSIPENIHTSEKSKGIKSPKRISS